jgi:hypothetical protein
MQAAQRQGIVNNSNFGYSNNDDYDYDSSVESQYSPSGYLSPGGNSHVPGRKSKSFLPFSFDII